MKYEELNELIDSWINYVIEKNNLDIAHINSARVGFFNAVLMTMSDEEREKIAHDFNLKRFKDETKEL
jgi:hypothetical protein